MTERMKAVLDENEMPRQWYNIAADLPKPMPPPVKPDGSPVGPQDLAPVFPMNIIEQEMSTQRWPSPASSSACSAASTWSGFRSSKNRSGR